MPGAVKCWVTIPMGNLLAANTWLSPSIYVRDQCDLDTAKQNIKRRPRGDLRDLLLCEISVSLWDISSSLPLVDDRQTTRGLWVFLMLNTITGKIVNCIHDEILFSGIYSISATLTTQKPWLIEAIFYWNEMICLSINITLLSYNAIKWLLNIPDDLPTWKHNK